jgi:hypothetical protein
LIKVGRAYDTALKSETVATVLVRGNQQDIRLFHNRFLRRLLCAEYGEEYPREVGQLGVVTNWYQAD